VTAALEGLAARRRPLSIAFPAAGVQERLLLAAAVLLSITPLVWPETIPLTDLPQHMSRYWVALHQGDFAGRFDFHWVLVGNLGVDLLMMPLGSLLPFATAVKVAMMIVIASNVGGMLLVAREIHGRVPPTTYFALPFAYSYGFNFGFVNFVLSMGLALIAFALWLRLGRLGKTGLRVVLFVPIAFLVWLAHASGWVALGMLVFAYESTAAQMRGRSAPAAICMAGIACLPLAPPMLGMLHWVDASPTAMQANELPEPWHKLLYLLLSLRNGHSMFDVMSVAGVLIGVALAIRSSAISFDRRLAGCAALFATAFLIMPGTLMGAFYADMRLAGYVPALALLAMRVDDSRPARWIAIAGLSFLTLRMAVQTATYAELDRAYQSQLAALDSVPRGARIFASVRTVCFDQWQDPRMTHLARLAIIRRNAFVNGSWPPPGAQLMTARPELTPGYVDQDSELLKPETCRDESRFSIPGALSQLPRDHYDYYWLIGVQRAEWPKRPWLKPVWEGANGVLFRVDRTAAA